MDWLACVLWVVLFERELTYFRDWRAEDYVQGLTVEVFITTD